MKPRRRQLAHVSGLLAFATGLAGCGGTQLPTAARVQSAPNTPAPIRTRSPRVPSSVLTPGVHTVAGAADDQWKPGGPQPNGSFVFVRWPMGSMDGKLFFLDIHLLSDYGFMLINDGTYEHPKAIYVLGLLKRRQIVVCRSLANLRRTLRRIPRGRRVYLYDTCSAGTSSGVGEKTWRRAERAIRAAGLRYQDKPCIRYCVCGEGADPLPTARPELKANYVRAYGLEAYRKHVR